MMFIYVDGCPLIHWVEDGEDIDYIVNMLWEYIDHAK